MKLTRLFIAAMAVGIAFLATANNASAQRRPSQSAPPPAPAPAPAPVISPL